MFRRELTAFRGQSHDRGMFPEETTGRYNRSTLRLKPFPLTEYTRHPLGLFIYFRESQVCLTITPDLCRN